MSFTKNVQSTRTSEGNPDVLLFAEMADSPPNF